MGFQHMPGIVHEQASAKGGRVQKAKGLAKLSSERRSEIASLGGKAKHANRGRVPKNAQENHQGGSVADVDELSPYIGEEDE